MFARDDLTAVIVMVDVDAELAGEGNAAPGEDLGHPAVRIGDHRNAEDVGRIGDPLGHVLFVLGHAEKRSMGLDARQLHRLGAQKPRERAGLVDGQRRDLVARRGLPAGVIKACFPYSGVYDMTYDAGGGRRELVDMCVGLISGTDHAREASPLHWTEGNTIPFHVSWGDIDNPYCLAQAPEFVARLKAQPGRVETLVLPGFDHFWIHLDQQRAENPWTRTLLAWMTGDPETAPVYGM